MTDVLDDETLLSRLRQWINETRAQAQAVDPASTDSPPPEVGLYRLVEEFTALRHEVKLETKSTRGLQDQVESLLPTLKQAIDEFRAVVPKEQQAAVAAALPLAKAIADLDEALERGRAEIEKGRQRLAIEPVQTLKAKFELFFASQSWFRRRWLRSYHERILALTNEEAETARKLVDAMLEGYDLILARLRRAMKSEQILRMVCVSQPAEPERMTVVEVVDSEDVAAGHVVDEVRPGYTWRDRVLRFAEVRVARSASLQRKTLEED